MFLFFFLFCVYVLCFFWGGGGWLQCVFLALAFSFTLCRDMNQRRYIDPITSKHLEQTASATEGETHTRYVRSWMPVFTDRRLLLVVGSRNQSVLCVVGVCVCVCVLCVCVCVCVYVYVCVVCCWKFCCCVFFKWVLFVPTLFVGGCGVVGDAHQPLETFVTLQFTCPVPE